jgi:hypothetical protein
MYIICEIVARSGNNCCHGNVNVRLRYTVPNFQVAVNNIKPSSVVMETQQRTPSARLLSHRTFPTPVNNIGILRQCQILSSDFTQIWNFSTGFRRGLQYQISRKSVIMWEPR